MEVYPALIKIPGNIRSVWALHTTSQDTWWPGIEIPLMMKQKQQHAWKHIYTTPVLLPGQFLARRIYMKNAGATRLSRSGNGGGLTPASKLSQWRDPCVHSPRHLYAKRRSKKIATWKCFPALVYGDFTHNQQTPTLSPSSTTWRPHNEKLLGK
jgi:hypothetical protein